MLSLCKAIKALSRQQQNSVPVLQSASHEQKNVGAALVPGTKSAVMHASHAQRRSAADASSPILEFGVLQNI
jgi:hypothetical protein